MMNNITFERKRDCSGCFACLGICKLGAIKINQDENGFYKPIVDTSLCVNCGICKNVCYSHMDLSNGTADLKAYYGWHNDSNILRMSASGGITSAISQVALEDGYIVIGCTYDHKYKKAKHIIIEKQEDIVKILGSKYFQSDLSDVITKVKDLPKDTKIVFFGTPCQSLGFKKFLNSINYNLDKVVLVELFCHGITSPLVWDSYINQSGVKNVTDIRFRTKQYGWHIPANEFLTDKKNISTKKSGDDFFSAYYSTEFFNKSCYNCEAKKNFSNSDLRIGDFWGKRFSENKKGVSCIISSSEKGEQFLEKCKKYFCIFEGNLDEILSAQSYNKNHPLNETNWNENFIFLHKFGLKKSLANLYKRKPLLYRLKRLVRIWLSNIKSSLLKNKVK